VWVWKRGDKTKVALNLSDVAVTVPDMHGEIRISTNRERDSQFVRSEVKLEPWEGVIVVAD
jgi:hypothetical protein